MPVQRTAFRQDELISIIGVVLLAQGYQSGDKSIIKITLGQPSPPAYRPSMAPLPRGPARRQPFHQARRKENQPQDGDCAQLKAHIIERLQIHQQHQPTGDGKADQRRGGVSSSKPKT